MITNSLNEFSKLWSQVFEGRDREMLLAAAAFGLTVALRFLGRQHRARIERRVRAATAAYATRELAQERGGNPAQFGETGFAV